jgi:hypothetical protein
MFLFFPRLDPGWEQALFSYLAAALHLLVLHISHDSNLELLAEILDPDATFFFSLANGHHDQAQ